MKRYEADLEKKIEALELDPTTQVTVTKHHVSVIEVTTVDYPERQQHLRDSMSSERSDEPDTPLATPVHTPMKNPFEGVVHSGGAGSHSTGSTPHHSVPPSHASSSSTLHANTPHDTPTNGPTTLHANGLANAAGNNHKTTIRLGGGGINDTTPRHVNGYPGGGADSFPEPNACSTPEKQPRGGQPPTPPAIQSVYL